MRHVSMILLCCLAACISCFAQPQQQDPGQKERAFLVTSMCRIADPVLQALSKNELKKKMPVEGTPDRRQYSHLEAFGRLLAGMAPWLELGPDNTAEGQLRAEYLRLARICLDNATDPASPDFMNFNQGSQPLVDAAFLAQGLIRAPTQLWHPLSSQTKQHIMEALRSSRSIKPGQSNWLFFSAMVEAALLKFDGQCDTVPIQNAISRHQQWYKGDGVYGDGPNFHWDYYNSFVIQPMFLEVLKEMQSRESSTTIDTIAGIVMRRAQRYAAVQERMISPEGTYPPIGRSLAYRFGAFQLLSKMTLMNKLPQAIHPRQVRSALYTVIKRQLSLPGTFDSKGWLQIGLAGHQPGIGESYISTGSLYLCSEAFLILGLPASDDMWRGPDEDWTSKKVWKGIDIPTDHAQD